MSEWSQTISLRILIKDGKRTLQQRWTRIIQKAVPAPGDKYGAMLDISEIQERWHDIPVVEE